MDISEEILSILSIQMDAGRPWISAMELRELLEERNPDLPLQLLIPTVQRLAHEGILDVETVYPNDLSRGFITQLTVQGRNKWIYGHSLTDF